MIRVLALLLAALVLAPPAAGQVGYRLAVGDEDGVDAVTGEIEAPNVYVLPGFKPEQPYEVWMDGSLVAETAASPLGILEVQLGAGTFAVIPGDSLQIPTCTDLVIAEHEHRPEPPGCGTVEVRVRTQNVGTANAGSSTTYIYLDGMQKAAASVPSLPPGGSAWSPWVPLSNLSQGTHIVTACADAGHQIPESDESNNCSGVAQ